MIFKKVVFFNGPPRCGKDTVVKRLLKLNIYNSQEIKFSSPLKESLPIFFGLSAEEVNNLEMNKEVSSDLLLGKSWREAQISLSETWAKPIFGKDVFGKIALNKIYSGKKDISFISDSGFLSEAETVINSLGQENCLLVRMYRIGCDFSKDSRSYWSHDYKQLKEIHIHNDSTIEKLVNNTITEIDKWLGI